MPRTKIALIAGGSGDIGKAIALELAAQGVDIALGYFRSTAKAKEQVEEIKRAGVQSVEVQLDLTNKESVNKAYSDVVSSLGIPSIIVHCAGDSRYGLIQDMTDADYDYLMDTHVRGAFNLVQASLPNQLLDGWGRIVFVSSIWGETGGAMEVLYSAAKSAQIGLAKSLAKELAPSGITVNVVAPGAIGTQMLFKQLSPDDQFGLDIPMRRLGTPAEVAAAVGYLCQNSSGYTTGQTLSVNGGWYT